MSPKPRSTKPRSHGQTFLTGPNLYLRPPDLDDVATAAIWHPSPFPTPAEVVEERLKEQLEIDIDEELDDQRLLICRKHDDRPVGSVRVKAPGWREGRVSFILDPNLPSDRHGEIVAEVITFLIPILIDERHFMEVVVHYHDGDAAVDAAAAALGMRRCYRCREQLLVNGQRRDSIGYEALHPGWVERLGMPRGMEEGPVERVPRSPAPLQWNRPEGDAPAGAIMVGERLFLRAFDPKDGALVSRWALQETEVYYAEGRLVFNPHTYGHRHVEIAEKEPPWWLRFAICLIETGELIGANGLDHLDWINRNAETETEIYRPEHRSKGYGTEAKHLLLEYAFERLGLHMIYSWVSEMNTRSATALRKQGYRDCGYFAWSEFYRNGFSGGLMFDLLADEWRAARR